MGALAAVIAVTVGATSALGAGITSIGVLTPAAGGTAESAVNAISGDGIYAVGYSNGANQDSSATIKQPVIWSVADGLVQLPSATNTDGFASGVVHRASVNMVGVAGGFLQTYDPFKNEMYYYGASTLNVGGSAWIGNSLGLAAITGPYNTARVRTGHVGEPWFIAGDRSGSVRDYVQGVDGAPGLDHRNVGDCMSNSIAGTGHTAGSDTGNPSGAKRALWMSSNNGTVQTVIPGGNGIRSEAFGINGADTILSGYDAVNATDTQAFVWKVGDAAMTLLGTLAGDTQSNAIAVNVIGGNYITAGYSSNGTTETAVIWDTTGTWDATGQAKRVSDLLAAAGADMSEWSSLTRVTTMSDDGLIVGGYGVWAADSTTRGFVATIVTSGCEDLSIVSSVSRKTHGTAGDFDVASGGWEGRAPNTSLQGPSTIVTKFNQNIQLLTGTSADVSVSSGTVGSLSAAGDTLTVNLTGIATKATFTIGYPGVAAACDASKTTATTNCWQVLAGEASGSVTAIVVNTSDFVYVRGRIGQTVDASNFRADVNADGQINTSDFIAIRGRIDSLFTMPPTCP